MEPSMSTQPLTIVSPPAVRPDDLMFSSLVEELAFVGPDVFTASDFGAGCVRHIVLYQFKPGLTGRRMDDILDGFLRLQLDARRNGKPYIVSIDGGYQQSGERQGAGFQLGFIVTFESLGDRNYFVGSPVVRDRAYTDSAAAAFRASIAPFLTDNGTLVFDLVAQ